MCRQQYVLLTIDYNGFCLLIILIYMLWLNKHALNYFFILLHVKPLNYWLAHRSKKYIRQG
jgi:hypothetical protein